MGNYASCALGGPGAGGGRHGNKSRGAKVLFPSGDIKHFYQPINAAELMFENPNHFLVGAQSLQIGRRFRALSADQDLEIGGVYVLFPMSRLNSVVSASDMGALFLTAKRAGSGAGKVKVAPEFGKVEEEMINNAAQTAVVVPKLNLDDIEDLCIEEVKQRLSMSRSKRPTLDTIVEEPVSVRASDYFPRCRRETDILRRSSAAAFFPFKALWIRVPKLLSKLASYFRERHLLSFKSSDSEHHPHAWVVLHILDSAKRMSD